MLIKLVLFVISYAYYIFSSIPTLVKHCLIWGTPERPEDLDIMLVLRSRNMELYKKLRAIKLMYYMGFRPR